MRRVFVYEYLSGGGTLDDDPRAAAELLPMGRAMRDAMVLDLLCIADCAVTAATCPAAGEPPRGAAHAAPRPGEDPPAFVQRLACTHDAVWLVAPECDRLLQHLAEAVPPDRWLGCSPQAIALAASKRATVERLEACGIPTPLAWHQDAEVRRWVVKPDNGAGAVGATVHGQRSQARADLASRGAGGAAWLEPWIEGEALSLSLLCGPGRAELLSVNRQDVRIDDGGALHFHGVEVDVDHPGDARRSVLASLAADVARAVPGLRGFVGIDLVWHATRGPVVIEINPRVTNAYVGLSASLGRNLAADVLGAHDAEGVDG